MNQREMEIIGFALRYLDANFFDEPKEALNEILEDEVSVNEIQLLADRFSMH